MNKFVVYTAIFNRYDVLHDPLYINSEIDYVCFTDTQLLSDKWKIVYVNPEDGNFSLANRKLKILGPYRELSQYEYSIYVDGSIQIKSDLLYFFNEYAGYDMVNFRHPQRYCLYSEIEQCLIEERGDIRGLFRQAMEYQKAGMPKDYSLSDNKIIFRKHNSLQIKKVMYAWWDQVSIFSGRDQVCLPYVLWKSQLMYCFFKEDLYDNLFFEVGPHRKEYIRRLWRFIYSKNAKSKLFAYLEKRYKRKAIEKLY
jgi:hypothetical protein